MSAQVKNAGRIGTKVVAAFLFLFLVMFNVEVGLYDAESSKSGILGLTMSVFVPSSFAGGGSDPEDCDANCECGAGNRFTNWNCELWQNPKSSGFDCGCDLRPNVCNPC